jgi:hypothetical protein
VNAAGTAKNRDVLEAMNNGHTVKPANNNSSKNINVSINNYGTNKDFEVQHLSENEVRIIAKDVASEEVRKQTPSIMANELSNPNSKSSNTMKRNSNTSRKLA